MKETTKYYQFDSTNGKEGNVFKRTGSFYAYLNQKGCWVENRNLLSKFVGGDVDFEEISEEEGFRIVAKRKNQKLKWNILIIIIILILFMGGIYFFNNSTDRKNKEKDLSVKENNVSSIVEIFKEPIKNDVITGNNWQTAKDKSLLCLSKNGTFLWYRDSEDKSDNYYEGTYIVYCGVDAINYIANDLSKYGITKDEQLNFISRNIKQTINNYYCLVLNNETCIMGGKNTLSEIKTTPYYGFYYELDEYLDFANMNTSNYIVFNKVD